MSPSKVRRFSLRISDKLLKKVRASKGQSRRSTNEEILSLIEEGFAARALERAKH